MSRALGTPRVHARVLDSTNARCRGLALEGAPHGTLVTAAEQSAGRGRQGRRWTAPPGRALLMSVLLRDWPPLLPLAAAVAVAAEAGDDARIKWPNDVLVDGRKVAGILIEGRPQERWMVLGIGLNVALRLDDLPVELRATAGTLARPTADLEPTLERLLGHLEHWMGAPAEDVVSAFGERDALTGRRIRWAGGSGEALGIDAAGRLRVRGASGEQALDAGEVHLAALELD